MIKHREREREKITTVFIGWHLTWWNKWMHAFGKDDANFSI